VAEEEKMGQLLLLVEAQKAALAMNFMMRQLA
jgi:hypothetical protein